MADVPDFTESNLDNELLQKKSRESKIWRYECTFPNEDEAQNFIKSELCWSLLNTNQTKDGMIKYYRCNKVKRRGEQCKSGLKLIYNSSCTEVLLHRLETNHNCEMIITKAGVGISNEVKIEIEDLFRKKFKPKAILEHLIVKYVNPPNINQVKNYLAQLKKSIYSPPTISLEELEKWLKFHVAVPTANDTAFVINYFIDDDLHNGKFQFMVSSKTLLKLTLKENLIIHADTTYKLTWQGFPVLLVGTTDRNKKFHLLGITVCSEEQTNDFNFMFQSLKESVKKIYNFDIRPKILIANASDSIRNGFQNTFGKDAVVRMCWTHMRRTVQKKLQTLTQKENINKILTDINAIQISENEQVFLIAYKHFVKKWAHESEFLKYFQEEWFEKNQNWYEGVSPGTPSTNNALESTNRMIRDENIIRERLPLNQFCYVLIEIIEAFSRKYENNSTSFADEVFIDLKMWTSAYQWAKLNKKIENISNSLERNYLIPAGECNEVNKNYLDESTEDNFDEYIKKKASYYKLSLPMEDEKWKDGQCTCSNFLKNYICKHLIGVAIRFKYIQPPLEAMNIEIGIKRKRGRPPKEKKALLVQ